MGGALSDATELSVPTILTSGLIAFALIPPLVVLSVGPIELKPFGVLRDAAAYAISLGLLIAFSGNSSITSTQDVSLIMVWTTRGEENKSTTTMTTTKTKTRRRRRRDSNATTATTRRRTTKATTRRRPGGFQRL